MAQQSAARRRHSVSALTRYSENERDAEIARIAAFLRMDEVEFIERETEVAPDRKSLILKSRPDGSCVYLTDDNLCRINSVKPDKCRTFPFEWTNPDSTSVCLGLAEGGVVPL